MSGSEPALPTLDIGSHKILVALGEINDSFDQTDEVAQAAGYDSDHDFDDPLCRIAKDEFVDSKSA